ncbi:MAG TPA: ATP-dependent metallopeptidase FtsH/Yme1/Tma family protein, partial [Longimicrobium sp.]|nr:ATP-dependent metallopeptidase FtsH/Yme1/Tma family protein [Longimicrobium sp.]
MEPPIPNERRRGPDRRRGGLTGRGKLGLGPLFLVLAGLIALLMIWGSAQRSGKIDYSELRNRIAANQVERVAIGTTSIVAYPRPGIRDSANVRQWTAARPADLEDRGLLELLDRHNVRIEGVQEGRGWGLIFWLLPLAMIVGLSSLMMRRMNPTQGVLTVGKSRARIVGEEGTGVTFADV